MDEADWYLNLAVRGEICRNSPALLISRVRSNQPLIFRAEEDESDRFGLTIQYDNPTFGAILRGQTPVAGIREMTVMELYFFEQWLSPEVREFAKTYDPDVSTPDEAPTDFEKSLNDALKRQLLGRFCRIDLSLPDDVLQADLARFLTHERARLSALRPEAPYRKALAHVDKHNSLKLDKLADYKVLALMDVRHWAIEQGKSLTNSNMAALLDISDDQCRKASKLADTLSNQLTLNSWLLPRARDLLLK